MDAQKKILIIDDDPDYVEGITSTLKSANFEVEAAYNPKDGFQALTTKRYDLLVLDIMMGRGAEGVALARKIRKEPSLQKMPILIVTGIREQIAFLFPGQAVRPHFVEFDELVEKPVEPKLLLEKISSLLQRASEGKS